MSGTIRSVTRSDTKSAIMPELTLDFTWYKHPEGLPPRSGEAAPAAAWAIALGRTGHWDRARPDFWEGREASIDRPLEIPNLVGRFIEMAKSEAGVLKFVEKFGPLTDDGLRGKGEVVPEIMDQVEAMVRYGTRGLGKFKAWIEIDHEGMRLKVRPSCLLDALWLLLAQTNTHQECANNAVSRSRLVLLLDEGRCEVLFG